MKSLSKSALHQNAIFKMFEIIGEAAKHVDAETRKSYPQIPWQDIIGFRNRIVHAYFQIDLDAVWAIVSKDIPQLIVQLERIASDQQIQ